MAGRLERPLEERESVDAGFRHINFLDGEIAEVQKVIAAQSAQPKPRPSRDPEQGSSPQVKRAILTE